MTSEHIQPLLKDLREGLEALYGKRLEQMILYGSHARGEANEESDVDVLTVLSGDVRPAEEIFRTGQLAFDVGFRYNELISVIAMSEEKYSEGGSALARNVRSEGRVL